MRLGRLGLGLLAAWALAACAERECQVSEDCPEGSLCDGEGRCFEAQSPGNPPRPDSGVGPRDAGVDEPEAGPVDDAGRLDGDAGIDGGARDAGPTPDAGPVDSGPDAGFTPAPELYGFVWLAELRTGGASAFRAYGVLEDRAGVTYDRRTQTFPDGEGGQCALRVERRTSGTPAGLEAASITVAPNSPQLQTAVFLPRGDGRFTPDPLPERVFSQSNVVLFNVRASAAAGSVQTPGFVSVPGPPIVFEQTPPEGATVSLAGLPTLAWAESGLPTDTLTVELFDRDRDVVLSCPTPNDGRFRIPSGAVSAFEGAAPTRPFTLELRHDREVTGPATVGPRSFEITYRASWGAQFAVQ